MSSKGEKIMKKVLSLALVLALVFAFTACGGSSQAPAPADDAGDQGVVTLMTDNWSVKYDSSIIEAVEEGNNTYRFNYLGEAAGECYLKISDSIYKGKSPEEVLGELTADWDETQIRTEAPLIGADGKWSFIRIFNYDEGDLHVTKQYTAAEFGDNDVILFEFRTTMDDTEGSGMAQSDALAEVVDSIEYNIDWEQTEYSYVPGTYVRAETEEIEGQDEKFYRYIHLYDDHTGTLIMQDEVKVLWGSNSLMADGAEYQYTIEGDNLYLEWEGDWLEYHRALPAYKYGGSDALEKAVYDCVTGLGDDYVPGEVSIPCVNVIAVDDSDAENVKVWGDFWVFNYDLNGDTLECVSGGAHPGMITLKQSGSDYEVTDMAVVEDGSKYTSSAKEIFGEYFDKFSKISSDDKAREELRAQTIRDYVSANGLAVSKYKDYGWDPVEL